MMGKFDCSLFLFHFFKTFRHPVIWFAYGIAVGIAFATFIGVRT